MRPRRAARRRTRRRHVLPWLALFAALWLAQLALLARGVRGPASYWAWRAFYRPGIKLAQLPGVLPGDAFDPLRPSAARLAFVLAAGAYAALAVAIVWVAVRSWPDVKRGLRPTRRRRRR